MKGTTLKTFGVWAFICGVVLALLVGIAAAFMQMDMSTLGLVSGIMVVLGIVVGVLNITEKEVTNFIIAAIGLTTGSAVLVSLGTIFAANPLTAVLGKMMQVAFTVFGTFVAGAVFIPALKAVYEISKD
jgi:hypothetical protein